MRGSEESLQRIGLGVIMFPDKGARWAPGDVFIVSQLSDGRWRHQKVIAGVAWVC